MPVYQPSAIIGNSGALISLGLHGEIMTFCYPHVDFPQNLHEGMPAVYFGAPGAGQLRWTFEPGWQAAQAYAEDNNAVVTELRHSTGVSLDICDFVHPERPMLVRCFRLTNRGKDPFRGVLYQYLDLQLGEVEQKNGIHYLADRSLLVQYWRNICLAIGGARFDQHQCGRAHDGSLTSAKRLMTTGRLPGQNEDIGDVDCAGGWELSLAPGETADRCLIIAAANDEEQAVADIEWARERGAEALREETRTHWARWVGRATPTTAPPDLAQTYRRSLLALRLLFDDDYGSFLAAPEFDPLFERSGGYGYCWVRDAAEVVLALDAVGYPEMGSRFFEWARKAQREDGHWEQRYWINGRRGPVWSRGDGGLQIDQTGSMVFAVEQHRQVLGEVAQLEFVESMWESVRLAADLLGSFLDSQTGLHSAGMDLWETYRGSFAYTNAAIYGALRAAASFADAAGQPYLAESWQHAAVSAKRGVLERLWTGRYFARGVDTAGRLDLTVDSSTLGLVEPFDLLSLADDAERTMAESCVEALVERLGVPLSGGLAILRFEGDRYVGGSAGGVNTLWLARVLLRLALHYQKSDPTRAAAYRDRAVQAMRVVRGRATVTGLLPELIGRADTESGWAAPHGWCMAAFIQCVRLLDRYEGTTAIPTRGAA